MKYVLLAKEKHKILEGKRGGLYFLNEKGKKVYVVNDNPPAPKGIHPDIWEERDEVTRTVEDLGLNIKPKDIMKALSSAKTQNISSKMCGSGKIENMMTLKEIKDDFGSAKDYIKALDKDDGVEGTEDARINRFENNVKQVKSGKYKPILILKYGKNQHYLIGGNTRAMIAQENGLPVKAKIADFSNDSRKN